MNDLSKYLDENLYKLLDNDDNKNDLELFGREIKRMRLETSISQKELASLSGLSQSCISNIEKGKYNCSIKKIIEIANCMNCKIIFRLEESNERQNN